MNGSMKTLLLLLLSVPFTSCHLLSDAFISSALDDRDKDRWVDCSVAPDPSRCDRDDTNPQVYPKDDLCDGIDDDGDGELDEDAPLLPWYPDQDLDSFGDKAAAPVKGCSAPDVAWSLDNQDCDDTSAETFPNAPELCDEQDNDCDSDIDEDLTTTYYQDADGDGYGTTSTTEACAKPAGYATQTGDCDDSTQLIAPHQAEVCDTIDNDCDGESDEGFQKFYVYPDGDSDGYAPDPDPDDALLLVCEEPVGYVTLTGDCHDDNPQVNPGAAEVCDTLDNNCDGVDASQPADNDGDGFYTCSDTTDRTDCDDQRFTVNPAALELCDGLDNNCNGIRDDVGPQVWYLDLDEDGFGDIETACVTVAGDLDGDVALGYDECPGLTPSAPDTAPPDSQCEWAQHTRSGGDCNDANVKQSPLVLEVCNGVDDNCNGRKDEGLETSEWYPDSDRDGYGTSDGKVQACSAPTGQTYPFVASKGDCDDRDASVHPGAEERTSDKTDQDCDGFELCLVNEDGDAYPGTAAPIESSELDCDEQGLFLVQESTPVSEGFDCDEDDERYPGQTESCNGKDDDCNGEKDDGIDQLWFLDEDGDGYGVGEAVQKSGCDNKGFSLKGGDCDDTRADVFPEAAEVCDGRDNSCDGVIDEGVIPTWYLDVDSDGFGGSRPLQSCEPPDGYVSNSQDCNDADANIKPGATEVCNGVDDNCAAGIDEGYDQDQDTFTRCAVPTADCDDGNGGINPAAVEVCDDIDNNCDGQTDPGDASDALQYYQDLDGDGYGNPAITHVACEQPEGYVEEDSDCDDRLASVNPSAEEVEGDGLDNNCDGSLDPGIPVIEVCVGKTGAAQTIQAALDEASSDELIAVCPGRYDEQLHFNGAAIRVLGTHGPEWTVIDGSGRDGSTVLFNQGEPADAILEGFTVKGGSGSLNTDCGHSSSATERHGGAICIQDASPTLRNLVVTGDSAQTTTAPAFGGGIYVRKKAAAAAPRLDFVSLTGNTATVQGGGLYGLNATLSLERVLVSNNTASDSSGSSKGGGLALLSTPFTAKWLTISGNTAKVSGGGLFLSAVTGRIEQAWIHDNTTQNGGGLMMDAGTLELTHARIERNKASGGGGVWVTNGANVTLSHSLLVAHTQNSSGGNLANGGGLYLETSGTDVTLEHCIVAGNSATSSSVSRGGGIYVSSSGVSLRVRRSVVAYNAARGGGANLYAVTGSTTTGEAACLYMQDGTSGTTGATLSNLCAAAPPGFLNDPTDGNLTNDDYHLASGSILIGALSSTALDPDGSDGDVGLFGGDQAGERDLDGDGFPEWFWTTGFDSPPVGIEQSGYDCLDLDAALSECRSE